MEIHSDFAQCDKCGWHGPVSDIVDGCAAGKACPECGTPDPWWIGDAPPTDDGTA